ncbi:Helix-turn-helix domain protein [Micromonospora sp. MW-13]|uniref:ArsR/SmtB family transcription factor n=1 Tax=Micromonospora sp. MW-13 TaxID=2094022 RepID=UPI000E450166|nr:winged helix-turn-helix domain-containing protein [Micromonospora sp. MW-13]RGC68765.1 Helix-turn-helix domain protein [Micromonospora sp. MW-13]
MVYRIHFTAEDLGRTRLMGSPSPLVETMRVVRGLWKPSLMRHVPWTEPVVPRLPAETRLVLDLAPARGYSPNFLSLARLGGAQECLEQVRSTPRSLIRREMTRFAEERPVPGWARRLDDDPQALQLLADALGQLHATLIAPYWDQVTAWVAADRAARARDLVDHGIDHLLRHLCPPQIRWNPPVLEIHTGLTGELHLSGRGLLLIPSVFGFGRPSVDCDAEPQPWLSFPIPHNGQRFPGTPTPAESEAAPRQMVALLGRTRATVLHVIAQQPGCTTGELAATARISASSASEHATVLRAAGLITTTRRRQSVLHVLTPTGRSLLDTGQTRVTSAGRR